MLPISLCYPILLALAAVSLAQTAPPATQPTLGEVQRLRAENAALKERVAEVEKQVAAKPSTAAAAPAGAPAATQPKEVVRTFTTMQAVLATVPAEVHPAAGAEWAKYTEGHFHDWLQNQLVGMKFDARVPCKVATASIYGNDHWALYVYPADHPFDAMGTGHSWGINLPRQQVTEDEAKKWDKVKSGTLLHVTGTVENISIHRRTPVGAFPQFDITMILADAAVALP